MTTIRVEMTRVQRDQIEMKFRATKSRIEARRCRIILLLADGERVREIQKRIGCVRSTIYHTLYRFEDEGIAGLEDKRLHPGPRKATPDVRQQLLSYLDHVPQDYGWQRSTWTLELFSLQLARDTDVSISPSHLAQVLRQERCRRGRPRPTLRIPVRGRRAILEAINVLVHRASAAEEVFYADEADIDLNPRIGLTYMKRGQQLLVPTPGQNVKYYAAGALNARTGRLVYAHGPHKNSALFIDLLQMLHATYRRARAIHVVLDNYIIHKSQATQTALEEFGGKVHLHFLPPYSPKHNAIERLWKQLHDNVTRNHRHPCMPSLWKAVTRFLHDIQPFPGTKVSTTKIAA